MPGPLASADFDGDGALDVAIARADPTPALVWTNDGAGIFIDRPGAVGATGKGATAALARDLNGDGRLDLVLPDAAGPPLVLLLGRGVLVFFDASAAVAGSAAGATAAAAGDFDGDGRGDLLLVGPGTRAVLLLRR